MVARVDPHPNPLPQAGEGAGSLSRLRERVRVRARELRHSSTEAENAIWQRLRARQVAGYKFRRQHPIGVYFADFACIEAGLIVELDGSQHFEPAGLKADDVRSLCLHEAGFHVLRFDNRQALTETDAVMENILHWLVAHHPHPNPLPQAGEGANTTKD